MTVAMTLSAPSQWLANELTALLSAPNLQYSSGGGGDSRGGGGGDFSSRFDSMFLRHARGLIGEREVDGEELKRSLLALQKRWDPAHCRYENCEELHHRIDGFHVRFL